MERYDYERVIKDDVLDYIQDNIDLTDWDSLEELEEHLNDELWACDSVTGNASGSYFCSRWKAAEAVAHNWDLLAEVNAELGDDSVDIFDKGEEHADVMIRCYLLSQAIAEAMEEIEGEWEEIHEEDEEEED